MRQENEIAGKLSVADRAGGSAYPPVWVISLESAADRRQRVTERLNRLDLDFELVPAFDATSLRREDLAAQYDPQAAVACTGGVLSYGQVATALSHLAVYRKMLREGVEEVLVLEDDAVPLDDLLAVLANRDRFPSDWEAVLLYHGPARPSLWGRRRVVDRYRVVRFVSYVDGAVGYLLRASGARKLLAAGEPVRMPSDYLLGGWHPIGLRLYGVQPHCVLHDQGPSTRSSAPAGQPADYSDAERDFARASRQRAASKRWWRRLWRFVDPRDAWRKP